MEEMEEMKNKHPKEETQEEKEARWEDGEFTEEELRETWPTEEEILKEEEMLFDIIWYNRHRSNDLSDSDPVSHATAIIQAKIVEEKYGIENLGPFTDLEYGILLGKLAALRWVTGADEKNNMDT